MLKTLNHAKLFMCNKCLASYSKFFKGRNPLYNYPKFYTPTNRKYCSSSNNDDEIPSLKSSLEKHLKNKQEKEAKFKHENDIEAPKQNITEIIDNQVPDLDLPPVNYRPNVEKGVRRTVTILKDDVQDFFSRNIRKLPISNKDTDITENVSSSTSAIGADKRSLFSIITEVKEIFPSTCDVLIVGGGIMGMSIAYHMKEITHKGIDVVVVEKDNSYSQASTVRSVGGIRQQFSIAENIQLSQYGMEFLRRAPQALAMEDQDPIDVGFHPNGYLTLASDAGFEQLKENFMLQRECGAKVELLPPSIIKERFPWMNVEGVAAGVLGIENEGWFDPWTFLLALRHKSCELGAKYVHAEFLSTEYKYLNDVLLGGEYTNTQRMLDHAIVRLPSGEEREIKFAKLIIAAGAWSGEVGRRIGIGAPDKTGILSVEIPIEPRKRFVYCIHSPDGPGLNSPLCIDPNGTYFRREGLGDLYLCGQSPTEEPSSVDLEVDEDFFLENVWPTIAHRVPSFESLKLRSSWSGYYDYNYFDQNGIIGIHPGFSNVYIASGFSGHGLQQGAGIGRAMTELIIYDDFKTLDLSRLAYDRILMNLPLFEKNIV